LHSGTPALWVYAASWEVQKRQDMDAARALLSRGLRSCPESTKLWHEYFRLELVYALRLRERRDALGLAGGGTQEEALLADDPAKALLLAGGVARVVHKQALAALPQAPVGFHTGFLDVLAALPVPFVDVEVRRTLFSTTLQATPVCRHLPLPHMSTLILKPCRALALYRSTHASLRRRDASAGGGTGGAGRDVPGRRGGMARARAVGHGAGGGGPAAGGGG
jgi:hypothetical protein